MESSPVILVIDDEPTALLVCEVALRRAGLRNIVCCDDSAQAMKRASERRPTVVLLDLWMPKPDGEELLKRMGEEFPQVPVIIMTGANDADTAVRCMKAGAFDYLVKPVEDGRLYATVKRALDYVSLEEENAALRSRMESGELANPDAFAFIMTRDPRMFSLFLYAEAIAATRKPILITGETGVGKDLFARAVHAASGRSGEFVAVNVGGLDDTLFSDTLFGHVRGAFTGADGTRKGMIERAAGGTLFLDEIGDLPAASQVKLLRLVQNDEYMPLGQDKPLQSQARIVAATNSNLEELMRKGTFRKDLFYRLRTHRIGIPPLRDRRGDIPLLLDAFLDRAATELGKKKPTPPRELAGLLAAYHFPGNVRELESMVFEAVSRHRGGVLSTAVFSDYAGFGKPGRAEAAAATENAVDEESPLAVRGGFPTLKEASDYLVREAVRRARGNQSLAARMLGISRPAVSKRLKQMDGE